MFSDLFEHILKEESKKEFEEIFQPISSEEHSSRIMDYIRSVCTQNEDGTWSCEGDVDLSSKGLKELPVKFKKIGEFFTCSYNQLTSLQGAPKEVGGFFDCSNNKKTVKGLKKTIDRPYMDKIQESKIQEGKKEDLHKQFVETNKVPEEVFNSFVKSDPTDKQKYLQWMLKQYVSNPRRDTHIKDVVKLFDELVSKGKLKGSDSDIFQYDLESLDQKVSGIEDTKTKGEIKREEKSEAEKIKETDRYLIVVPKSYKASCFYGANTKWCISGKTSSYWKRYWEAGVKIYIIIDKKQNKKYAVAVHPLGEKEVYNEKDDRIEFSSLVKKLGIGE